MTKLCPRGKAAAKRKFKVYPSAYANAYASKICAGKIKDPSGKKRKDFRGPKPTGAKTGKIMSKRDKLIKKQNPISEYDEKGKLKYTAAKKGKAMMIMIAIGKKKKADKKMGGGLAAATEKLKAQGLNKGGGADYMNTVKPRKRGNPGITGPKPKSLKEKNKFSGGGMARGAGIAIRGSNFKGTF